MSDYSDLAAKLREAKRGLPLPQLLATLGLAAHAKKVARCPFDGHEDKHPSFSIFKRQDGFWKWKCFSACGAEGDEIDFLSKWRGIPRREAMTQYLEMAGFPRSRPPVSPEYPKFPEAPACLMSPTFPVSPVSEGQGAEESIAGELKSLAARNACTAGNTAWKLNFRLARDLSAVEGADGTNLSMAELHLAADEWFRRSKAFLPETDTQEQWRMQLVANMEKVRFPTGENPLTNAIKKASQLTVSELPVIPGNPDAPEDSRRLAALHRELSIYHKGGEYFLSYRDAAKVLADPSHQRAHSMTLVLKRCCVVDIAHLGRPGNSGRAAEFRYLLPNGAEPGLIL